MKFINKVLNIGIFNTNIINLTKKIINITKLKNINLVHEKYNIDNRSYEVSLTSVKKIFKNFNFEKYVKNSIIDTFKAIKKDRSPFNRKKVTLNIYKDYLNK